ncbi:hypothetical protein GNI_099550 [Gregarina niphandrodes]|uniref:Integrase zinc-binding domain-containing protein n=1 Tax=Gregarina niphandrodes TaxID=110365 RepID=A0A023B4L9_GRENI|nr:hypothetical protein GNI_099550 [Gregarina niphandrodes]EZG57063.1 hypothetical protein GNI_099550 [Gregarina niphandrodes]|eukprot:XP_011131109.1 hypothetical protein GNI_099550 [Gregarina niphandrodes]
MHMTQTSFETTAPFEEDALQVTLKKALQTQASSETPHDRGVHTVDNVVYYRGGIYVPPNLRKISDCHQLPPFLQPGDKRTKSTMFNWPYLHQDATKFVTDCLTCQRLRDSPKIAYWKAQRPRIVCGRIVLSTWSLPNRFHVIKFNSE